MFPLNILKNVYRCRVFNASRHFSTPHSPYIPHTFETCLRSRNGQIIVKPNNFSLICARYMAGHSKWQNIKHIKAEKDREKNLISNKFAFLIRKAAQEGGSNDPKINSRLASVIEAAKKNKISSTTIENNLKKDRNKKSVVGSAEILGPGGCIVLVEYETDSVSVTRHDIKVFCKKYGAHVLSGEGRWRAAYEQKGIVKAIARKDGQELDPEKALDDGILAGAEEVLAKVEDDSSFLEFLCAPEDLNSVKKEIEKDYTVEDGYIAYNPIAHVELDKPDTAAFEGLMNDLESIPSIVRIFENVK